MKCWKSGLALAVALVAAGPAWADHHATDEEMMAGDGMAEDDGSHADADCFLALSNLMAEADESEEDAFFAMAMFYFGSLNAKGGDIPGLLNIRLGALKNGDANMQTIAEECAVGYYGATEVLKQIDKRK